MTEEIPKLSVEGIVKAAQQYAGLDDLGPDFSMEGLRIFIDDLNEHAQLTPVGAQVAMGRLIFFLVNAMEITDWIKRHPEILDEEIKEPVFIVGMARTGTTILFDLLALDDRHRVPQSWEVSKPCPPPEESTYLTDPRIQEEAERIAQTEKNHPLIATMNPNGAQLPQEDGLLRGINLVSPSLRNMFYVPNYAKWLDEMDYGPVYAAQRRQLQLLQWRYKKDRWVLKSPQHLMTLDALLNEFPDAYLIQTHRDPISSMASLTSLCAALRGMSSDALDKKVIAREWMDFVPRSLNNSVKFRESGLIDPDRMADLMFRDFISDPVESVKSIYEKFGFEWRDDLADKIRHYIDTHPAGGHKYSFSETGLDETELRERFKPYQQYFKVPSEKVK